ncbi:MULTISPECIES: PTS lactose/cellobiose transporter subunit IIA [unclassified Streptococcus]|uniref:PTS lactose/cellobiose transporter subunit IIA n=1 Tax=unclassified Streptococcus TaxID=2608887 RepID=UPI001072D0BF|nr:MULTISPECIES: PTS lactose/cellobiose transporter subunit IIA [unclassified Streptococcus]MBF0787404.1 PTS lactose/cellobiose transporter subunit IIA [Streptococcus sp. 19428wC2_LYSM12]MCQ9211771.1 PTS lactose/cellobiose transporter subunit IIA [Streptococcus sp. B01]MCQ9213040.1 PTS lactose/cellobiose transporter subunit IIA [Streptococcus sp. O1]TFV05625.1 PTS lactose/cellobiose transporter subunit IIA [Streptococcus sp. LYSM12]
MNEISFELISKAGTAFSLLIEALREARQHHFESAEQKRQEAEQLMNEAHNLQTQLIVKEMNGEENQVNVLLIHAQGTLMNTILMSTVVEEFILFYKKGE